MERLERLTVHVREAVRLASSRNASELRIALMLFDSAVELMMHRAIDAQLAYNTINRHSLEQARWHSEQSVEAREYFAGTIADLSSKVISKTRVRKLERDFGAKVDFLTERELLSSEQARVLHKLHDYRNETYHRDHLRAATIRPAVRVYGFIALDLMADLPRAMFYHLLDEPPEALRELVPGIQSFGGGDHHVKVAAALKSRLGFSAGDVPSSDLSEHLLARVSAIHTELESIGRDLQALYEPASERGAFDKVTILHVVQLTDEQLSVLTSAEAVRATPVPVTTETLELWRAKADAIAGEAEVLIALGKFADLEDEMEPFEEQVENAAIGVDRELQLQIDIARGR